MLEFDCHDWSTLQGFRSSKNVRVLFQQIADSADEKEWQQALGHLESYASDQGIPSEATKGVVASLVAIAVSEGGRKRSAVLGTLEELTCGRGVEAYTSQQLGWLRASVQELACALHTWTHIVESAPTEDATLALEILAYCGVYVSQFDSRVQRYFQLCAIARPELREEISALLTNSAEIRSFLVSRDGPQMG